MSPIASSSRRPFHLYHAMNHAQAATVDRMSSGQLDLGLADLPINLFRHNAEEENYRQCQKISANCRQRDYMSPSDSTYATADPDR
jgi:hypothetical protein